MTDLVEEVAALEHDQWVAWSYAVAGEVSAERQARWLVLWVPYAKLSETMKEKNREYARKVLAVFRRYLEEGYFYDGKDTG